MKTRSAGSEQRNWFVTGTGTGVGKTIVSAALCHGLLELQRSIRYWKPIQTGIDTEPADAATVSKMTGARVPVERSAWIYGPPRAPDQAASIENRDPPSIVRLTDLWQSLQRRHRQSDWVVEGAGGLLVPLDDQGSTWRDFVTVSSCTPLVVARTDLGTLNHTCLSVEALENCGCPPCAVVLCGARHEDNLASLRRMLPNVRFLEFPFLEQLELHESWSEASSRLASQVLDATIHSGRSEDSTAGDWLAADRAHAWHPFTQHATENDPLPVVSAQGSHLITADGGRLIDGIGSWWTNTIGHGRPEITRALASQHRQLDHVLFAGVCHPPAARLAKKMIELTGDHFSRVFFSDNGSTSVEVALKMARQYWVNRREPERTRMVAFRGSYHGDTFGAMAVGAESGFFAPFGPMLFDVLWADLPTSHHCRYCPDGEASFDQRLTALADLLSEHSATIAGVILEPLVQGAAGMLMHSDRWLQSVASLCRQQSIPLIFDEVFTGFGRLGSRFAFQRAGVLPDIICLSKAITGGTMPLAVTVATDEIFAAFLSNSKGDALLHGHSYTANPLACNVALQALEILQRERLEQRAQAMERRYRAWLERDELAAVRQPRTMGSVLAFELPTPSDGYFTGEGRSFAEAAESRGLYVRPLGNTVYLAPSLAISDSELETVLEALTQSLHAWSA